MFVPDIHYRVPHVRIRWDSSSMRLTVRDAIRNYKHSAMGRRGPISGVTIDEDGDEIERPIEFVADGGPGDGPPTLGLHTFPLPFARYARLFREGARLVVPPTRQVPPASIDPHRGAAVRQARADVQRLQPGLLGQTLYLCRDGHVVTTG